MTTKQIDGESVSNICATPWTRQSCSTKPASIPQILLGSIYDYSDAGFMKVARNADRDTDTALNAFHDQVKALVDPFNGWLEEWGFT